ncbi:TIGR02678 family protein [Cohnella silvisoli]|uniref:TIGR02678 family protein n=1 Tax=Cohnella silvisoli TaxID=2873699 RepID=A0ABV1KN05_9BACL|nr:TIGR02678 family protein [Cohnella silvisoli]MCD9020213.1 TIGR02678 family protein [Cohnella silvisoli]
MAKIVIGKSNMSRRRRSNIIDKAQRMERMRTCVHALLNRPWIIKERDSELYYWIKDQYPQLREWFLEYTGFSIIITKTIAKLDKAPVEALPWMGFQDFKEPLDYAFFTFSLWYLEGKTEFDQFLLTNMVEEVRDHMTEQGMLVDWKDYYHRLSMARALKKLKNLGILQSVDGEESAWAHDSSKNVLYECSSHSRYILRKFPQELTAYRTIEELGEITLYPDTDEGVSKRRKHRVYRRFLLEPVVHDKQWKDDDLYYVLTQRHSIMEQMNNMLGWEGRRYQEGLIFFHPELTAESELFPTLSSISDLALLVIGEIRRFRYDSELSSANNGTLRISKSEMEHLLIRLHEHYKEYWNKEHRDAKSHQLAAWVFEHLTEWGFGVWEDKNYFLLYPIAGRWIAEYISQEIEI